MFIHLWKIVNYRSPKDVDMTFKRSDRHGVKVNTPPFRKLALIAAKALNDSVKSWNTLMKQCLEGNRSCTKLK